MPRLTPHASACLCLLACNTPAAGQNGPNGDAEGFVCANISGARNDNTVVCRELSLARGPMTITSGLASGREPRPEDGEWQLSEGVRVTVDAAEISAESAIARFAAGELEHLEISGDPVTMSDVIEGETEVSASANRITFERASDTLRMLGREGEEVRFAAGEDEYITCALSYNLREKSFNFGGLDCGVHVARNTAPGGNAESFVCANISGDFDDNSFVCRELSLARETVTITAGLVSGREPHPEHGEWQLSEGVRVTVDAAEISAESAIARFAAGELKYFDISGDPVAMSDIMENGTEVSASANRITFERASDTLRMLGREGEEVRFAAGEDEYTACALSYNLRENRFDIGEPDCAVRGTLNTASGGDSPEDRRDGP